MLRLGFILHLFIGSALAGSAMIVALVMGYGTLQPIVLSALIGFVAAFPVTYFVAKALYNE
ncbi:CTP synthetase [Thalassovita aquimarina]|uniref:CTP synthetase n=1 Tax=Thalassovita aquimarina TaxID=2785917 RepID=UPI00356ABD0E